MLGNLRNDKRLQCRNLPTKVSTGHTAKKSTTDSKGSDFPNLTKNGFPPGNASVWTINSPKNYFPGVDSRLPTKMWTVPVKANPAV